MINSRRPHALPALALACLCACAPKAVVKSPIGAPQGTGLAALPVPPQPPATWDEKNELRAGWVVGWRQMTSTAAIDEALDWAETARLNALFVQARASGDAYYRSDLAPRAEELKEQPRSFDPLGYAIEQAHARGLKVHAWVNMGVVWRSTTTPASPQHVFNAHPEWIMRDAAGRPAFPRPEDPQPGYAEENYWINWNHPAAQDHLVRVVDELATRYPIDGIHFDFVRYPARMGPRAQGVGYDPVSIGRFRAEAGREPAEHTRAWDEWRAREIGRVLERCGRAVKARRPDAVVSAAVLGAWNLAYGRNFTDYRGWLDRGVLDEAVLTAYYDKPSWVWQSASNARERADGRRVALGLYLGNLSPEAAAGQIAMARELGLRGFSLFSLDRTALKEPKVYLAKLRDLAIPDARDDRYALAEPLWNRVGVLDAEHRSFSLRFYSRRGKTKLVVYPQAAATLRLALDDQPFLPIAVQELEPIQIDLTPWLDPFSRQVAANHDFTLTAAVDGPPQFSLELFTVDYYDQPALKQLELGTAGPPERGR